MCLMSRIDLWVWPTFCWLLSIIYVYLQKITGLFIVWVSQSCLQSAFFIPPLSHQSVSQPAKKRNTWVFNETHSTVICRGDIGIVKHKQWSKPLEAAYRMSDTWEDLQRQRHPTLKEQSMKYERHSSYSKSTSSVITYMTMITERKKHTSIIPSIHKMFEISETCIQCLAYPSLIHFVSV